MQVYGLDDMWFGCYTENSQLETIEINSVVPIMFSGSSGEGIFYRQDGAVTLTITAPGIVDVEGEIIGNYGSPVNMILNLPATTVFEKKWFSGLRNNFAVTIPTGATGHIPAGYVFKDSYNQEEYDHLVADGYEDMFWHMHSDLVEGVDYTLGVESSFVITAENASQIFGQATVSFKAPTEASNSEWVLWRKSDLKEFPDMSSGDQKVCKDVTVKVNNGVYNTDSGFGIHFKSSAEDGVQFVAPEGKVFKRIVILNEYGTFSDPNWSYDGNYKKWSGSANTVGFEGDICGISLIEFELGELGGDDPEPVAEYAEIIFTEVVAADNLAENATFGILGTEFSATISDSGNKMSIDANKCRFGGNEDYKMYEYRLKSGGASSSEKNFITLNIPAAGKIRIAARSSNSDATDRALVIEQGGTELYNAVVMDAQAIEVTEGETTIKVFPYVEVSVTAGSVRVSYTAGMNFYGFGFMEVSTPTDVESVESQKSNVESVKVIRDGQLLIIRDGMIYNVMGTVVR